MGNICQYIILLGFVMKVASSASSDCDTVFQGNVRLSVVNEIYPDSKYKFPSNLTLSILQPIDEEENILTLDLQQKHPIREGYSGSDLLIEEPEQTYYLLTTNHSTTALVVSKSDQASYKVSGEMHVGTQIWNLEPDDLEPNGTMLSADMHLLTVKSCKDNNTDIATPADHSIHTARIHRSNKKILTGARRKRSLQTYTVELLMVIDNAIYDWWKSLAPSTDNPETQITETIQQYYAYVFKEIDNRFVSMEQDLFEINMAFAGIIIAENDTDSFWTSTSIVEGDGDSLRLMVNSSEALEKFQQWLDDNPDLPPHDHAILFTGSNLTYAGSPGNTGLAFEASMCRNISNSSIVEEAFDARTVTFAVRQIARSLGVRDDMDNNDCLEFFNFIMAPKFRLPIRSFPSNRWLFSTCSVQYFKEYIDSLNEVGLNCLQEASLAERFPVDLSQQVEDLPGKFYRAKEQCINKFGTGSDICRGEIGAKYSKLCSGLMCTVPGTYTCDVMLPADGTPCGNMKYCYEGECSQFEDADRRLETCVFGNEPGALCEDRISISPPICYNETARYECCMSCAARETGLKDCEYGDRAPGCIKEECLGQSDTYKAFNCCLTCSDEPILYRTVPIADFLTSISSQTPGTSRASTVITSSAKSLSTPVFQSSSALMFGTSNILGISGATYTTLNKHKDDLERRRQEFGRPDVAVDYTVTEGMQIQDSTTTPNNKELPMTAFSINDSSSQPNLKGHVTTKTSAVTTKQDEQRDISSTPKQLFTNQQIKPTTPSSEISLAGKPTVECITKRILKSVTVKSTNNIQSTTGATTTAPVSVKPRLWKPSIDRLQTTTPVKVYGKENSLNIYDRIFFKELARSMRRNQVTIRRNIQQSIKSLYSIVSRRIGSFLETEGEHDFVHATNTAGEKPSNDDDDLNRQLKPIWLSQYRGILRDLEMNIKQMRYRVLMMVNRHIRQ